MQVTDEGLALIRRFEGFRAGAYRDPVGVWTIGYGHTSMAGTPEVKPGMVVSRAEAQAILARDVAGFAKGVASALKNPVNEQQFSALVSFAYNVGLANFRKSSVLAAVNAGDMAAVPRRLNLWVKAGGRVLPGLVTRRAAEGRLFASGTPAEPAPPKPKTQLRAPPAIDVPEGKTAIESKTVWAALTTAAAASFQALGSGHPAWVVSLLLVLAVLAAAVIISERIRKSREEGV